MSHQHAFIVTSLDTGELVCDKTLDADTPIVFTLTGERDGGYRAVEICLFAQRVVHGADLLVTNGETHLIKLLDI